MRTSPTQMLALNRCRAKLYNNPQPIPRTSRKCAALFTSAVRFLPNLLACRACSFIFAHARSRGARQLIAVCRGHVPGVESFDFDGSAAGEKYHAQTVASGGVDSLGNALPAVREYFEDGFVQEDAKFEVLPLAKLERCFLGFYVSFFFRQLFCGVAAAVIPVFDVFVEARFFDDYLQLLRCGLTDYRCLFGAVGRASHDNAELACILWVDFHRQFKGIALNVGSLYSESGVRVMLRCVRRLYLRTSISGTGSIPSVPSFRSERILGKEVTPDHPDALWRFLPRISLIHSKNNLRPLPSSMVLGPPMCPPGQCILPWFSGVNFSPPQVPR